MHPIQETEKIEFTVNLVYKLLRDQFPQWAHLPIRAVESGGHDNRTFRLGEKMLVRLPSAKVYALKVLKEQKCLKRLAPRLTFKIPEPVALGMPSKNYPWNWSIYKWIEGKSANLLNFEGSQLELIAVQLAQFLNELHKIDISGAPSPGLHNFYRGENPSVYDGETRNSLELLKGFVDKEKALDVWETAISTRWKEDPVWIHGDFASGNILIKEGALNAVVDFGGVAVGDPACDLVIAWTFLKNESREIFKEHVGLDPDTWARARGWALWKAGFELVAIKDKSSSLAVKQLETINELLKEENF